MALVLMCGLPLSGKTTVANALSSLLLSDGHNVQHIHDGHDFLSDNASPPPRSTLYATSAAEKSTRSRLRAATERALATDATVICDSLNYIKGFRYELYCVAKTSHRRFVVIHVTASPETCVQRDEQRQQDGQDTYGTHLCQALIRRFEPPSNNRWDKPLFPIDTSSPNWQSDLLPIRDAALGAKTLTPTMATRVSTKPDADILGTLDRLTRQVETTLAEALHGPLGRAVQMPVGTTPVLLRRKPKMGELREMRRAYLSLARMHPPNNTNTDALVDEYVAYLNARLRV